MQLRHCVFSLTVSSLLTASAFAAPGAQDRVYTADQNTNTVSVINPATNFMPGKNFAIQIDATAFQDLAGNPFAGITDDVTLIRSMRSGVSIRCSRSIARSPP